MTHRLDIDSVVIRGGPLVEAADADVDALERDLHTVMPTGSATT